MNRWGVVLSVCVAILLTGCASMLNRSYSTEKPHAQFLDAEAGSNILGAETYQGLVSAVLHLVSQGEETGVIRLYDYTGAAETDLDAACLEVTQQDPLGAYAVEYIRYNVSWAMSYYEANLKIVYRRTPQQIASVVSVTGNNAIVGELEEALEQFQSEVVLKIGYFDETQNESSLAALVNEAYYAVPAVAFGKPQVTVGLYPSQSGQQRVVEILLTYPQSVEGLKIKKEELQASAKAMVKPFAKQTQKEQIKKILHLMQDRTVLPSGEGSTAYSALLEEKADSEGMALAVGLLCQICQIDSQVIQGNRNGEPWFWNIVKIDGQWQHLNGSGNSPALFGDVEMQNKGYSWIQKGVPLCQKIS